MAMDLWLLGIDRGNTCRAAEVVLAYVLKSLPLYKTSKNDVMVAVQTLA